MEIDVIDLSAEKILAHATVDLLEDGPLPLWEVTVWGEPPFEHRRLYTLVGKTDNNAAQEGIRLFVEEMSNLASVIKKDG